MADKNTDAATRASDLRGAAERLRAVPELAGLRNSDELYEIAGRLLGTALRAGAYSSEHAIRMLVSNHMSLGPIISGYQNPDQAWIDFLLYREHIHENEDGEMFFYDDAYIEIADEWEREADQLEHPSDATPVWDANAGELAFNGKVIREVSGRATNLRVVLDSFEELGWPKRIDSPLKDGSDPERVTNTIKSLNKDLAMIRFGGDGSGTGFVWEMAK